MRELSMHILDIAQNSIAAGAELVEIDVIEDVANDKMIIRVTDDGRGMPADVVAQIRDPFVTSRTTRRVGLGIPLLAAAAERCGGGVDIASVPGGGTTVTDVFEYSHVDRAPLGNMAETLLALVVCNPNLDFVYNHVRGDNSFHFDTREIRLELGSIPLSDPEVVVFIRDFVAEGERRLDA
jgi:anti-sigma regulatory factor (Ser/Thr protein kinase)